MGRGTAAAPVQSRGVTICLTQALLATSASGGPLSEGHQEPIIRGSRNEVFCALVAVCLFASRGPSTPRLDYLRNSSQQRTPGVVWGAMFDPRTFFSMEKTGPGANGSWNCFVFSASPTLLLHVPFFECSKRCSVFVDACCRPSGILCLVWCF